MGPKKDCWAILVPSAPCDVGSNICHGFDQQMAEQMPLDFTILQLLGGCAITILKNDGVRRGYELPNWMESHKIPWSSHHQSAIYLWIHATQIMPIRRMTEEFD